MGGEEVGHGRGEGRRWEGRGGEWEGEREGRNIIFCLIVLFHCVFCRLP